MKKLLLVALMVSGAVLAGCGNSDRKEFIAACMAEPQANEAVCNCIADNIEKEMGKLPPGAVFKSQSALTEAERKAIQEFQDSYTPEELKKLTNVFLGSLFTCPATKTK